MKIPRGIIPISAIAFIIPVILAVVYFTSYRSQIIQNFAVYMDTVYKIERGYIENLPIYGDFTNPEKESTLRKYLQKSHMAVAREKGTGPLENDRDIDEHISSGKLVKIEDSADSLIYFYNVRKKNRCLTPSAYAGLKLLAQRFQKNISKRKDLPPVKLAVSSALRTSSYQKKLSRRNYNAVIVSTHNYGVSFDIFFDDYFVALPDPAAKDKVSGNILSLVRRRFGFLLGDALRRQFRAVLMETLIELQEEGKLYAILERRQRCYHITIL